MKNKEKLDKAKSPETAKKRKKAEETLHHSEERYRTILENIEEGYFEVDLAGNLTFFNDALCRVSGYSREELMGMNNRQYTDKEELKKVFQAYNKVYTTGEPNNGFGWQFIRKDGAKKYIEGSISLLKDSSGKLKGFRGIAHDITERRLAEEKLRESEASYRQLFDNSPSAIYRVDFKNGRFLKANDVFCKYLGCSQEEITSISPYNILTEESKKLFLERLEKMTLGLEVPDTIEYEGFDKNGKRWCLHLNNKNIYDAEGHVVAADVVAHDITDRKRAENALKESEKKYRLLADNVHDVIFVLDMNFNYTYISPSIKMLRGYEPEEVLKQSYTDILTPSSVDLAMKTLSDIMELEKIKHQEITESRTLQLEMRRKDGTTVWTEVKFSFIRDENQRPVGILGVTRDITERKQAEDELRESEHRYQELSIIDDLTQLHNSRHFYAQLEKEIERSNRYEQPLTLLMLDLDNFKTFNDTYGHVEGDYVLSRLGQVMKRCLRDPDSAYRYGGEEFTIMLPMTTSEEGMVTAKRIHTELRKEAFSPVLGQEVYVTVSIGLAQYKPKEEMKAFVNRVDQLMYQAKKNGRDRICPES